MKKYKVVDNYELDWECIGYADTLSEVIKITEERVTDTDGECAILYYPLNEALGEYDRDKAIFIESY